MAALVEATRYSHPQRHGSIRSGEGSGAVLRPQDVNLPQPIVTRAVQLVNGRLDFVVFQLNTLDLKRVGQEGQNETKAGAGGVAEGGGDTTGQSTSDLKNFVWIQHGVQLYKPGAFYENYDSVVDLNPDAYRLLMGLLLTR
ncbi:unnamed protein product [Anisakis simplex]|uniref:Selenoprotein O n=1 Tax=Anisakis simplex TaxID=6269 RepID=A0A0M3JFD4_ANISI|nr:unnamed protein product [Anisakis simplex]